MVIDLRGRGRRAAAGLFLLAGLALAVRGAGQVAGEVAAVVSPGPVSIRRVARTERVVALTFDAAWGVEEAEAIVTALVRSRLPATFFPSGAWLVQQGGLAQRMVEQGFEFGNATESYPHLDALPPEAQADEIRRADARLTRLTGKKVTLFRPPYGETTPTAELVARELGYRTVLWSVDALDGRNPPPELIAAVVERNLAPGAIIRLTTAGRTTAKAIPLVSRLLARRGYRAVTLSELLLAGNYYVDRETGEQRPLPGSRAEERPVLAEWWERWRRGAKKGVTFAGQPVGGLLPEEIRERVEELARRLDRPPQEARWDEAKGVVQPEVHGRRVDVEATLQAVLAAPAGASVQPVVRTVAPRVVSRMFSPVYRGRSEGRRAALMFNVAWGNEVLPQLLAELAKAGVKATFFVEGRWVNRYPELLREIAAAGHCLGSHAYQHLDYRTRPPAELRESLRRTEEAVREAGGTLAPLFAPPAGAVNPAMARTAAEAGYWTIMWTADTIDWQQPAPGVIRERVRRKLVPGCLILLHPTVSTVRALPDLIADLRRQAYTLVTVAELLPASAPP
ncbi:MAG: polysaccharide deacetylase family protein [Bacillota bacterium]|nr:polysaccharide deacetylase family protein [Bacillota bacterium]